MIRECRGAFFYWETMMLALSRKKGESIQIGTSICITIVEIQGDKVRLGVEAPSDISVHRQEVFEAIKRGGGRSQHIRDGLTGNE